MTSIVVPLLLGSLQLLKNGPKIISDQFYHSGIFKKFIILLALPLYPIYFKIQELMFSEASKEYIISVDTLEEASYYSAQFFQVDIGLESHLQLVISITLLLLASSKTNTITGLEVLFENENFFYMNTKVALALSIVWSLISSIKSQINGMSKKRQHSTGASNALLLIYISASIALRVFTCIMYLTPALGLFNSLRHLQGESYPYWDPYYYPEDIQYYKFYYGNAPPRSWSEISRWTYKNKTNADPPQLTLYTYFTIEQYLGMFLGIFALQFTCHLVSKRATNPLVMKRLSWIDCVIHCITCCFLPFPMKEWDEEKGTIAMHKARQMLVLKEMLTSVLLNFAFNLLLLTPLVILGINIFARHDVLVNSIGAFPEETTAYEQIKWMIGLSYPLLVLLTITQMVTYYLYNGRFHPFALILEPKPKIKTQKLNEESVKLSNSE